MKWTLRKASYRWPPRYEAVKLARVGKGVYQCRGGCKKQLKTGEFKVDHINPVVNPRLGFTTWDEYIRRMFCKARGYQVLCKECHDEKTKKENEIRRKVRSRKAKNGSFVP